MLSRQIDTNLFLVGEMRVGEMKVGEMRVGEMKVGEIRRSHTLGMAWEQD